MGIRQGLLALLVDEPKHGYQLKLDFEEAASDLWTLNIGQVYGALAWLERDGLVVLDIDDGERKSYRITEVGRKSLEEWLLMPEQHSAQARDEVTMKMLLALASGATEPAQVVAAQRESATAAIGRFTRSKAGLEEDDLAALIQLDRLVLAARAELDWLDLVESRMEARDGRKP